MIRETLSFLGLRRRLLGTSAPQQLQLVLHGILLVQSQSISQKGCASFRVAASFCAARAAAPRWHPISCSSCGEDGDGGAPCAHSLQYLAGSPPRTRPGPAALPSGVRSVGSSVGACNRFRSVSSRSSKRLAADLCSSASSGDQARGGLRIM